MKKQKKEKLSLEKLKVAILDNKAQFVIKGGRACQGGDPICTGPN